MNFVKISKRDGLEKRTEYLIRTLAILLSLVFAGLMLLVFGLNPLEIFKSIIEGSLGTQLRIEQTINRA
ncbi:MAG: ABC transporter permease, partial [Bacillota bacterium]|nr:ABC transporter permease [Bacillota bacterium]